MARIKYYYDTETCKYERVRTRTSDVALNSMGIFFFTLLLAYGIYSIFNTYFESPKELMLKNEVSELKYYYAKLNREVKTLGNALEGLEHRDDNIYRVVLGAEPIDKSVRDAGVGGVDRYAEIKEKGILHGDIIVELNEKTDKLRRKLYIESKSQDEVVQMAEKKEKLFAAIPAIQPIANKELIALASGFGMRVHPIYKVKKMHTGIDFAASIGTPIYATADGRIAEVSVRFSGY